MVQRKTRASQIRWLIVNVSMRDWRDGEQVVGL